MNNNTVECFINGVKYKCRTCFDPGQIFYPLTDVVGKDKTWRDLLMDLAHFQINEENLLPSTVCCICLEKLENIYDFILQIENVNNTYSKLLETINDPLHETVLNDIDTLTNCLAMDAPLEEDGPEIKLEENLVDLNSIALDNNIQLTVDIPTKFENEESDEDDPFSKHYDPDFTCSSDRIEEEKRAERKSRPKRWRKTLTTKEKHYSEEDKKIQPPKRRNRSAPKPKESNTTTQTENTKSTKDGKNDDNIEVKCSFSNDFDPDFNCSSNLIEEEERAKKTSSKPKSRTKRQRKLVTMKEENDEVTEKTKLPKDGDDDNIEVKSNMCPYCSKTFKYRASVEEHIKCVHKKIKPFKCSKCDKTFSLKAYLKSHELSHTDIFPFKCEYCERRFRRKNKLNIHTEIHTTKPELLCPICHRGQKSKEELEEHIKNHDYKRLQCISCGKLFSRNSNLTDHYNAVHLKLRPFKCQYCELTFSDRKSRRMHERKYHPQDPNINISQRCNESINKCGQMTEEERKLINMY